MHFFDSYAIIEVLNGNPRYQPYAGETVITTVMNLAEAYYSYLKKDRGDFFLEAIEDWKVDCLSPSTEEVYRAMRFRRENAKKEFSLVDCIGYSVAQARALPFLTGDKGFEDMTGVEWVQ